ncbi:hypothetical protein NE237_030200 [Protea cynaroides]|uniref:Uncharacterized protein n=1 Tax=Protea cynaroides TaxID=273540 RepID=A0A9Q0GT94_9MAGN|nr:hypothetical protein NE237_030200 [Protea cynaroides]
MDALSPRKSTLHDPAKLLSSTTNKLRTIPYRHTLSFQSFQASSVRKEEEPHQQTKILPLPSIKRKRAQPNLLTTLFNTLDSIINNFIDQPLPPFLNPENVFRCNFSQVDELPPTSCPIIYGHLPSCLDGAYIRNGPNPQYLPRGPYHNFDGDGMLHSLHISGGRATFCSRYVKTYKYCIEYNAGTPLIPNLFSGFHGLTATLARGLLSAARILAGDFNLVNGIGVANTSLAFFSNRLFALVEYDLPYSVRLTGDGDIQTIGRHDFDGKLFMSMTAHPKIDPVTDIQMGMNLKMIFRGGSLIGYDPRKVPRIGVIPRYAKDDSEMRWFEVAGLNMVHTINAWDEEEDVIVLIGPNILSMEHLLESLDLGNASVEKVRIDSKTGIVTRFPISEWNLELGVINPRYVGSKNRYSYLGIVDQLDSRISGVIKLDLSGWEFETGRDSDVDVEAEAEDDGYLVTYVHNMNTGESRFLVMDAKSPSLEIVAAVKLPRRVPGGFHGIFVGQSNLQKMEVEL